LNNLNIIRHQAKITRYHRNRLNNHKSIVLWFTGLSGSGKSTLAHAVEEQIYKQSYRTFVLDGDNIRHGMSLDLGFSEQDRKENIRRIGEVAKLMLETGVVTLAAFISPFKKDRESIRKKFSSGDFIEIYCKATLEACELRDVKGLYKKARAGEIKNYTGIDSPYEESENPELILYTDKQTLEESVQLVLNFLKSYEK